jgi:hypothetical protein
MSVEANKAKRQVAIDITTLQSLTSKTRSFAGDLSGTFQIKDRLAQIFALHFKESLFTNNSVFYLLEPF